ncbi:MAG: lamin tail domain-containing protein [Archangium sp.]|nr:lamin tail domain-containing protein [Archangium sp.]
MKIHSLVFALAALTIAGCKRYQPATEVPPPPVIESFTASATTVNAGETVTLSWKVTNATGLELREATLGTLNVGADQFEGTLAVTPQVTSLYVLTVRGETGTDARAIAVTVPPGRGAVSFQALPPVVMGGDVSTLVWIAPGASTVTLSDGTNSIDTAGQVSSGAVTVRPLADTTYTLTVDGTPVTTNVVVQPAVLRFTATPGAVESGQPITLSWGTAGATRVVLTSPGRGTLLDSTTAATVQNGSFTDTAPQLPEGAVVAYQLEVEKGAMRTTRELEVFVGTGLQIVRLDAPVVAALNGTYIMRWTTIAADAVEVRINGAVTYSTANPQQALLGSLVIPTPSTDFTVELIASNQRGATASRSTQVDVVGVPTSVTLMASPGTVAAGSPVTLTWAATDGRHLRIVDHDQQPVFSVNGQMAEGGTAMVYPHAANTTYTITVDNGLGSAPVTATAQVTVTGTTLDLTITPHTAITGATLNASANDPQAVLVGFPHEQVLTGTTASFIDIKGTGTQLDILDSPGVASADTGFSVWLWGVKQNPRLTVCRAGWMAFGAPLTLDATEVALPSTGAPRFVIAPFWDDLRVTANSGVYWQVVGDAPNEKLIVQWDRMQVGTDTDTELTFQAQVDQNGSISFQYQTVTLTLPYTSFVVGVQDGFAKRAVSTSVVPESDSAFYFFSPVAASADLRAVRRAEFGGFVKKGGMSALLVRPISAISMPDDLAVTEVMFNPRPTVVAGQYAEFLNRTEGPIDLTGWYIRTPAGQRFDFPNGFTLQPDVNTVIGASLDPVENDDAGVTTTWGGGFSLPTDGGTLAMGAGDAGFSLGFLPDAGAGIAMVVDPGWFRIGSSSVQRFLVCNAATPFGGQAPQQLGTPGAHSGCGFGYRSRPIAEHFVDITATGTALVNSATAVDGLTVPITLAPTPMDPQPLLFGVPAPIVSMSVDGFIAPYSTTAVNFSNKTITSTTTAPRSLIAPFWDDLQTTPGLMPASDMYWKRMAPGEDPQRPEPHWIFQWHRVRHYSTTPADDLNFEVKLFEDGVIEYHYATMSSGTTTNYGDGNSATVWLEQPDAGSALTISVNTPDVRPNSAVRFIPQ